MPDDNRSWTVLPLAQLLPGLTRPAFRRRSPAGAMLMSDWTAIVGPALAAQTEPRRLAAGQLTIACAGPVAMELQHLAPILIERINGQAGQKLVERLRFIQGTVATHAPQTQARKPVPAPEPIVDMPPGDLNDALARLRAAISGRPGNR